MSKKITSTLLIIMFSGIMTAPFFHGDNCAMVCCTSDSDSPIMLELKEECISTMSECHPSIFIPVINGPKSVFSYDIDLVIMENESEKMLELEDRLFAGSVKHAPGLLPLTRNLPLLI